MAQPPPEQASVDFFISYTSVDRAWAEWIAWALEEAGYSTLIQAWDFRPGTNFVQSMQQATMESDRTIMVLSPDYLTSAYATPEWQAAFAQDPTSIEAKLLPVRVRECTPEGLLRAIVYIDLAGQDESVAESTLLDGIPTGRAKPSTRPGFPGTATAPEAPRPAKPRFPGALPPIWNVPHDRNPNFTGRTELLTSLHDSLHAGNATVLRQALRGLGGVGKTQLALEYAYRQAANYSVVWWVPSETSPATVYAELTRELGLPEANASESDVRVRTVKRWLEQHGGWLLVFDNATEPEAVKPYLPQGQGGHVIITSRYWDWGDVASGLGVEVFDRETESVPFLLRRTDQTDEAAARVLADALGNLPLALAQAAAYIASTGTTLAEYTELFETRRAELWAEEEAPGDYPVPVGTTWSLAMDEVKKEPGAAELLYLLAYFAPEPVSRDLLVEGAEHLPDSVAVKSNNIVMSLYQWLRTAFLGGPKVASLREVVSDPFTWNRVLAAFRRYGLMEVTDAGLLVHRLVQAVTRDRLTGEERKAWAAAAVQMVAAAYPEETYRPDDISIWQRCAELLSHAQVAADHAEALAVAPEATGELLSRVENYLDSQGRYLEATSLAERALRIGEKLLGSEHPTVADRFNNLAELYRAQGRYADAEPLYHQALSINESALGPDHPEVAINLNNMAALYRAQGRYAEAEPLYHQALSISESALGADHPSVATRLNNLANLYCDQGRYAEAEPLYHQALSISESALGADHPTVAAGLNNLAGLYLAQGRYAEAEPLYNRSLSIDESALGADHPDVATDLNNLANLYRDQGRYDEAEPLAHEALQISEKRLGSDHPDVAIRLNTLAELYRAQTRYDEAEPLYQRALAIADVALGPNHPRTQRIRSNYDRFRQQRDAAS